MSEQHLRTEWLIGSDAMARLKEAHVAVLGLGGVGSFAAEALARSGVGNITLVDFDRVALTNLNRQLPALHSTLGRLKAEVMAERIQDINPDCQVTVQALRYTPETSSALLTPQLNCVVDAIDSLSDKIHLLMTCYRQQLPIVSSMGMANRMEMDQIKTADLSETSVCPLCRRVRRAFSQAGINPKIPVVFSTESPHNQTSSKRDLGSISYIPSIAGLKLAGLALRQILHDSSNPTASDPKESGIFNTNQHKI